MLVLHRKNVSWNVINCVIIEDSGRAVLQQNKLKQTDAHSSWQILLANGRINTENRVSV